jgi:hypothetical protein
MRRSRHEGCPVTSPSVVPVLRRGVDESLGAPDGLCLGGYASLLVKPPSRSLD